MGKSGHSAVKASAVRVGKGVRVVVSGQVGLDKRPLLDQVVALAAKHGRQVGLCHIGDMMYTEAPDVVSGRILDLPRRRLDTLRRSAFKDALLAAQEHENLIVNTHATFRWSHGLFLAYDLDQMLKLNANLYVTLIDNVAAVHERLTREHELRHSLKDILVWREEEIVVTESMAAAVCGSGRSYVLARGEQEQSVETLYRLMFEPYRRRVYPSSAMTQVLDLPEVLEQIRVFRQRLAEHFICFDSADLDDKRLLRQANRAQQRGEPELTVTVNGRDLVLPVAAIERLAGDLDGQIYARDFKLIDQSQMIVALVPQLPNGRPGISPRIQRELQYGFDCAKEVYVVWQAVDPPLPLVTQTATRVFDDIDEALQYFAGKGYLQPSPGEQSTE